MKLQGTAKYVRRTFQVLLHSVTFKTHMGIHFHSTRSAEEHSLSLDCSLKLNRTVPLTTVDLVFPDSRAVDSTLTLELYSNELPIGNVTFDIRKERLVKEQSKSIFRKTFNERTGGYIDYKFLSVKTDIISPEEFAAGQQRRNRVLLRKHEDYLTIKRQNAQHQTIEKEKDHMIAGLENKVSRLIQQNIDQGRKLNEEIERLRTPMNINVNILSNKQRALSSDVRSRNVENIIKDLSAANEEVQALRKRLQLAENNNQKLSENCRILIEELRDSQEGNKKVKMVQKKLSEVDNEYLLTKTISNYDKTSLNKALVMPKTDMHQNLREIQELLQQSNGKLLYSNQKDPVLQGKSPRSKQKQVTQGLRSMMTTNKNKTLRESHFAKLHKQISTPFREPQAELKGSGSIRSGSINSQQGPGPRESLFLHSRAGEEDVRSVNSRGEARSQKELKDQGIRGSAHLQRKEKEIEVLENQLRKKQAQIQKLTMKQNDYQKQYQEYQQEKARLFGSLAINSLSQGGKTSPDQAAAVRQLNAYNSELLKEKQSILEQLRQLKLENIQKGRKLDSYELATRKSLLFMNQLTKEKEVVEQRLKEAVEGERATETRLLAEKGAQYEALKAQFIQCEQEGTQSRLKLRDVQLANSKLAEETKKVTKELQELRSEKTRLKIQFDQLQGIENRVKMMDDRYVELQKLQKGLKVFVMKLESQMNLSMKKKDQQLYQAEMKGLLKETYNRINLFQESYYQTLIDAMTASQQAIERYYDGIAKHEADAANSVQKQEALWNNRMTLLKERQAAIKPLRQKEQIYKQKKQKKLMLIQDEYQSFLEHFKKLNMRLGELQSYRISLKDLINQGRVAEFTVQTEKDKNNNSSSIINQRDMASPNQLRSSLIKSTSKSRIDLKPTTLEPIAQGKSEQRKQDMNKSNHQYRVSSREDLEAIRQMQTSRMAKMQEESQRLKQSFSQNLALREEMSRLKLDYSKNETRLKQTYNQKQRELQRQLAMQRNEKESLNSKLRMAQVKLQASMKRVETIHDNKLEILQQQFDNINSQNKKLRQEIASLQQLLEKAGDELQHFAKEQRKAREEIDYLNDQREQLQARIRNLEQSENILLQQVKEIKQEAALNEMQVGRTIEELSGNFVSIERVKTVEIQKLKGVIQQLQVRLEEQAMETMNNRDKIEELTEQIKERDTIMTQRKEQWKMALEQLERELNIQRDARENLEHQNRQYHSHVLELSENIESQERQIARLNILLEAHAKEKRTIDDMAQKLNQRQKSVKEQGRRVEASIREKNQQLRKWQQNYQQLQTEVKYISRQLERTKTQSMNMKEQNDAIREQIFQKQREIINIDKEKGIAMINIEKLQLQIEGMSTQMTLQQTKIKELLQQQHDHLTSIRNSDRNQGKTPDRLDKSRRNDLTVSKAITSKQRQEDSYFSSRQMKVSRRMPDLSTMNGNSQQLRSSQKPANKGLLVPVMKTNKMLNLPSIDSDPPFTEEQNNLQIIQEHQQELNDTFLDNKAQNTGGSAEIEIRIRNEKNKRIDEQNRTLQSNSPYRADQSAVHIVADFNEIEDMNVPRFESAQTFARRIQDSDEDEYDGVRREILLQEIARLKQELAEAQRADPLGISQIPENPLRQTNKSSFFSKEIQPQNTLKPQKSIRILKLPSRDSNSSQLQSQMLLLEEKNRELQSEKESLHRQIKSIKEKLVNDQLYAAQMEQRANMAQRQAEQHEKNVNELMEEIKKVSEFNQMLQSQTERTKYQLNSFKEKIKEQFAIYEGRYEQLVQQSLQKDNQMYNLELQLGKAKQNTERYEAAISEKEKQIKQASNRIHSLQVELKKQKKNYIKYQQQSELQILHLKEEADAIKQKLRQKQEQITVLAEKYLLLEETNCSLLYDLKQQEILCENNEKVNHGLLNKFQSVKGQINANEQFRKNTLKKIHELQLQNLKLSQNIANVTKTASVQAQKWSIKLNAEKETISNLQQKLKDKQSIIQRLKNEIALYNQQCIELKNTNETLSGQLLKAERSLKDVMVLYESQFQTLTQQATSKSSIAVQATKTARNAQRDYDAKNREVRECREEIRQLKNDNQDARSKLQSLKLEYNRMKADFNREMQLKKDQLQTLRANLHINQRKSQEDMKKTEDNLAKMQQKARQLEQSEKSLQRINAQLKEQLQKLSKRPTKDTSKDIMINVLQQKLRKAKQQLQRYKSIAQKPQPNIQPLQKEMQALQNTLLSEKQKNANLCKDLKQVVEAFKSLQQQHHTLKEKNDKWKKNSQALSVQNKHLQRQVKELQSEIEQLQKDLSNVRFSRLNSFSKILTDTTIK